MSPTIYVNEGALEYSWCANYVTPLQHYETCGPQHEQAQSAPNVQHCSSTPGTISCLFSIISSPAAGIRPLLVSISDMQDNCRNIPTMTSPIAQFNMTNVSADLKNGAPCKNPDCTADTVPVGMKLSKVSTSDIGLRHRLFNMKHTTNKTVI